MRARLVRWLERRWYGGVEPNVLLRALASVYLRIATQRRREFLFGAPEMLRPGVPVIVIGNLTVGGAGKTPLTIALVQALQARGLRPGVVSRGYGRQVRDLRRVGADDTATEVGDEPLLIARRTGAAVAVAPGRYAASTLLERTADIDLVIADDGLQHYTLMRDIEILVLDGRRGFGNGHLLPAGPLREPLARATACDFVVVNAGTQADGQDRVDNIAERCDTLPGVKLTMSLQATEAVALATGVRTPLLNFASRTVHAVAGIADPERFFATLRQHGIACIPHPFPDHHAFTAADLDFGDDLPMLMTEKDAMKCSAFARDAMYFVPIDAVLPDDFVDAIAARVRALIPQVRPT